MKPYPKITFTFFLLLVVCTIANAQKLPNVQQTSLRAPAGIKIDGKATEWGNQFQAYNHATDVNYTLSNDDANLYLTVQATIPDVIKKILNGGITLTISQTGKKSDKGASGISYPVSAPGNKVSIYLRNKPTGSIADSLMNVKNKEMSTKYKTIRTSGIAQLDTLISVYNTENIKAAERFDNNLYYNYELAVPLKYLGITADSATFAYHIKINEVQQSGIAIKKDAQRRILSVSVTPNSVMGQPATDFWAEYTLAK